MQTITINDSFITITQFLKMTDYISSGGQAKYFLLENDVFLNNEKVFQRGKKIFNNDQIKIDGKFFLIKND